MGALSKKIDGEHALKELLSGFNVTDEQVRSAAEASYLSASQVAWNKEETYRFSDALLRIAKPTVIAANKLDMSREKALDDLKSKLKDYTVIGCSGAIELALRKAGRSGVINYTPGASDFSVVGQISDEQKHGLDYMADYIKKNSGTGVQEIINTIVFKVLGNIVAYPVEDENKFTDHLGNVLPDAVLLKRGSRALDLANKIHTDLAKGMLYAIDARSKMKLGKTYELKDNDVIKIVSAAK